jgi:putative PIN family toxin of toxin-antitoxin system
LWWEHDRVTLLTSIEFVSEVEDVLHRGYIKQNYRLSEPRIQEFLTDLWQAAEFVTPLTSLPLHSRDPKDTMLLSLALGGNADYLVTGDAELLVLDGEPALGSLRIFTASEFFQQQEK